jgi:hypothetical protein
VFPAYNVSVGQLFTKKPGGFVVVTPSTAYRKSGLVTTKLVAAFAPAVPRLRSNAVTPLSFK